MDQQRFLECRAQLMSRLELSRDMSDSEILDLIDELIAQSDPSRRLRFADRYQLKTELFNSVRRLDILQELLDDDTVTEIMVNGMGSIYIERAGRLMKWEKSFTSREKLQDIIQTIVSYSNRVANESVPIVDARLQRGERVNIVMNPIAIDGPVVTIRRFPEKPISIRQLISWGSVSQEAADFLKKMGIDFEMTIISAHREPDVFFQWAKSAKDRGYKVIIAGAGKAAHLPGMCAALFPLPVIGIPMKTSDLGGVDSLYSIVQMPSGIPCATVAINGGKNAGILAAKILAVSDPELLSKLEAFTENMKNEVAAKDAKLQEIGYEAYLQK